MSYRRSALLAVVPAALAISALAAPASATTYSFASDINHQAFTFQGDAAVGGSFKIHEATSANVLNLVVDDTNGPITPRTMDVRLAVDFTATYAGSSQIGVNLFTHHYLLTGSYSFYSVATTPGVPAGQLLMTVTLDGGTNGLFSPNGTATTWGSADTALASDDFANVTYHWTDAFYTAMGGPVTAAGYGILGSSSVGRDDWSFGLTALRNLAGGPSVSLDPQTHLPTVGFLAEGSYSGTSFVPAPTTGAALAAFAAAGLRRRRR